MKNQKKFKIFFLLIFGFLFFSPLVVQAMPWGTILYKTSENGRMYGYNNDFEFSLVPGKAHFGGVGIYIGEDKLTKEPTVVEVDYSGVRKIPAKYFVDLDKGEEFIGAKIPIPSMFDGMSVQMKINIINQIGEGFDFTYHKQKGPQSGDWTPAGFIEKIYESAESHQLAYHQMLIGDVLTYSINITQDGYDNESEVNKHHDVFSERFEYSKIHTLSQGNFWEQFFNKEAQDTLNLIANRAEQEQDRLEKDDMQKWEDELKGKKVKDKDVAEDYNYAANLEKFSKIAKGIKDIISVTIYGREYEKNRYFFFPYTQFKQKTLMHVDVNPSEVSSHGKSEAVGGLSLTQKRIMMTSAFFERLVYTLAIEKGKEVVMNVLGIGKIINSINAIKTSIGVGEEGVRLLSGGNVDIDTEKMLKETLSKNEYAQAALSFKQDADDFYQAGINESLEFFDLVNKGHLKEGGEFQRILDLELARISGEDEEIIDTRPIVRQLGDVIDISPIDIEKEIEKELKKLENKKIKDKDLQKLKELIDDEVNQDKPDEVELPQEEVEEPEEILKTSTFKKGDILINEFMPNSISDESEWIELYNTTDSQISLDNWTIEDNTAKPKSLSGLTIKPKSWLLLTQGQDFSFKLNNPGDIIILKYIDTLIDSVTYGNFDDGNINNNAPKPEKGQSLARLQNSQDTNQDNNDWFITTTPTQNLINKITAPIIEPIVQPVSYGGGGSGSSSPSYQAYQTGDVVINEIMYNVSGSDSGHEWIEIYNPGSSEIDLNSWKFYEAETNHRLVLKQGSWILSIGVYAVIADDADQFLLDYPDFTGTVFDSSFSLNNTSETVVLKDGKENTINEVLYLSEWGGNDNGKTIEKQADESWTESSVDKGTPGKENSEQSYSASGEQDPEPDPDTTAPIITLLGDSEINLETGVSYVDVGATALDDIDGDITANIDIANQVNTNIPGSYIIAYNVSDSADNPAEQIIRTVIISEPISEEQPDEFQQYSLADVVVSEIAWMGTKASEYDEWIELYNNLSKSVNLSGWHLLAADNSPDISLSGTILPHTYWILERSDDDTISNISASQLSYTGALSNDGEYLQLKDGTGKIIDELDFSAAWPFGDNETKASMERINLLTSGSESNNWQTNSSENLFALDADGNDILGTPRQKNSEQSYSVSGEPADTTAPIISSVSTSSITYNSATISWSTDENSDSQVEYGLNISYESSLALDSTDTKTHSITLSSLEASTTYHFRVISKDTSDNQATSSDSTFTTSAALDEDSLTIEITSHPNSLTSETQTTFEFTANENVIFSCSLETTESWETCTSPKQYTNLTEGSHSFYLKAVNSSQNESGIESYQWTIDLIFPNDLVINEFVADPSSGKSEWIELYNNTSQAIDLSDWTIEDNTANLKSLTGLTIESEAWLLLTQDQDFSFNLNNSGDIIKLKYQETIIDQVAYGDFDDGDASDNAPQADDPNSVARVVNGQDTDSDQNDFSLTTSLTPGQINVITEPDTTAPIITLLGDNPITIEVNSSYTDASTTASDDVDGDITANIITGGDTVDTNVLGTYVITYNVSDTAGNSAEQIIRTVIVSEKEYIKLPSLVISEIQISGDKEFVELYNPTKDDIALDNWYFSYYSSGQDWDGSTDKTPNRTNPQRLKQFPDEAVIQSKGYYLIGLQGLAEPRANWQVYLSNQLSNTAGSVVIYSSDPSGKSSEILQEQYIDAVAWGDISYVKEDENSDDVVLVAPAENQSLQRIENQDTDDNADDFFVQENPNPQGVYGLWLNDWDNRKILVIDNKQNANNLTDYQIKINIAHQSEMQSDFSDVRFTSSDGKTLLPYYREEEYTENSPAVFWIKVPEIPAYSEVLIFQYYKNNSLNEDDIVYGDCNKNEGCGENVFIWFDDFSTNRVEEYNHNGVSWDTKRKRIKLSENAYISPLDKNSGENLEIKNFYIKTKMYLEKETGRYPGYPVYPQDMAYQAFIDYRHSDNNTVSTDNFDDDDYLKFGINDKSSPYKGLRFDKNIYTKDVDKQATNILKRDGTMSDYFDKWGVYEVRAYKTNHQVDFNGENIDPVSWNVTSHYLAEKGKIYLRALDVSSTSWVWIDYLMIGQSTLPEPTIVTDKLEGYIAKGGQPRDLYTDFLDWGERKKIKISNTIGNSTSTNDVIDYAIEIKFDYSDVDGAKKDFSDIRFTDSDKKTILKYWNESYEVDTEGNSISAIFWVKVPKIPGTISGNRQKIIYMYYNNPSATYIGKGEDVFVWFDDFSTDRAEEYNHNGVSWDTKRKRIKLSENAYISPLDKNSGKKLEMKDVYIKTKMFLEKETGIYPGYPTYSTNMARQAFIDYRYQDDNNYWRFGLNHKNTYIYKGVIFGSNEEGNPFFRSLMKQSFYDKWGTFEIKAADNNHEALFVNENGQDWIAGGTGLNQKGSIYLRGLDIASTSWMWVDYLIISKYNPKIKVSDVY